MINEFEFNIGDFVVSKAQMEAHRLYPEPGESWGRKNYLTVFQVVEQIRQTCQHGGTQRQYRTRAASVSGVERGYATFAEIELEAVEAEPMPNPKTPN